MSARTWYRISAVNGKSIKSLYGVTYLYAATSLFKASTFTRIRGLRDDAQDRGIDLV